MGPRTKVKTERARAALVAGGLAAPEKVRAVRQALGLSLVALGLKLGVENPTISDWENRYKRPEPANRRAIHKWSVSAASILGFDESVTAVHPDDWDVAPVQQEVSL